MKSSLILVAFALLVPAVALGASYEIDTSHSSAAFSVKHLMISSVRGTFTRFTGAVEIDDQNPANNHMNVEIDVSSVDTGNTKRDEHLANADFFEAAKFPKIVYVSKSVKPAGPGKFEVTGDLTMHGVTRPVALSVSELTAEVVNPMDKRPHRGASATGTISRQDFGMKWNAPVTARAGDVMIGDQVKLSIDVDLVRKSSGK